MKTTWKDVPHLFYNFELLDPNDDCWDVSDIMFCGEFNIKDCTLIARRIEDISDDDVRKFKGVHMRSYVCSLIRERLIKGANKNLLTYNEFIFLNENGFYHLSQYDFDNGTVIDVNHP